MRDWKKERMNERKRDIKKERKKKKIKIIFLYFDDL